ncbi:MAG TPA: lasso peptide isopeptide bond-forming cyclase [Methanobacterium subterraneum]|uniref:Putative asparagine synthetase [glutamine-hydrolyzing] n=1 Tax=Methanobacterium subterraneum TaxID=59277 RepID=A0A7J4TJU1_9EURY|nr:lasso peptide isopeptide bond-forming cyclase [Methanobacterium subterraneum]
MSAITGIFYRDGRLVNNNQIKKMNDVLSHRGPDGSNVWCEGSVALGHQMLWTTSESLKEELPFEEEDLVITADARIDNRNELSEKLGIPDIEDVSDSYYILKAYKKWGEKCPEKLLGDFAFVIWDKKKEILFCARDHMGVKPLYYYLSDVAFFFATEIKALFCFEEVPCKLNELKLAHFMMDVYSDNAEKELTFFKNIFRIPPAHAIKLNPALSQIRRYWELDRNLKIELDSEKDYITKFLEIFTEAISCRLRSAFPIGFELSGGLDSSSVVSVAKKILEKDDKSQINTFSLVYPDIPESDESYYINKLEDLGGIKAHYLRGDIIGPLENIENILWHQEEPFFANNRSVFWNLYEIMAKENIRVLIGGQEGDSTVSHGFNYLKGLTTSLNWYKLIKEIQKNSKSQNRDSLTIFKQSVLLRLFPQKFVNFWMIFSRKSPILNILDKKFVDNLKLKQVFLKYNCNIFLKARNAKEFQYLDINSGIHQSLLEVYDRTTANFFIEQRYPFYDKRLIEFCYGIPTEQKIRSGRGRIILRKAMEDILPREIQWRFDKNNFSPVLKKNLLKYEKQYLEKIIYKDSEIIKDYIDLNELKRIYGEYKSQGNVDPKILEISILLIVWLQMKQRFKYCC